MRGGVFWRSSPDKKKRGNNQTEHRSFAINSWMLPGTVIQEGTRRQRALSHGRASHHAGSGPANKLDSNPETANARHTGGQRSLGTTRWRCSRPTQTAQQRPARAIRFLGERTIPHSAPRLKNDGDKRLKSKENLL